jgi:hypothetical protein
MLPHASLALLFVCAPLASAQGKVWIVDDDGGPGVDFTSVPEAVLAAGDGDTLLVKSGEYDAPDPYSSPAVLNLVGKGLVLTAERDARVVLKTSFEGARLIAISNLAPDQTVVLRGFDLLGGSGSTSIAGLKANQGSVRFEDCRMRGSTTALNQVSLDVDTCEDVTLVRTEILGHGSAIAAIGVLSSNVHLYACDVRGAHGVDLWPPLNDGGDAVRLEGGSLVVAGSTLRGGDGADFSAPSCIPGIGAGDAGDALQIVSGPAILTDVALAPGAPGHSLTAGCPDGEAGVALLDPGSNAVIQPAPARGVRVESPVLAGHDAVILLAGRPGELAFAGISKDTASSLQPSLGGALLIGAPLAVLAGGTVESWGSTTLRIAAPLLAPGVEAQTLHVQGVFLDPSAGVTLGAVQSLVVLAP